MERKSCRKAAGQQRRQQGAAIVEAVIALPILLAVILCAIQFGLVYEAKATLNHASLQAARAGAVANARPDEIRRGLARGLAPLYSPESSLQGVATTVARINAGLLTDARIRILNPTREAFTDFGEEVAGVREIPNDRLHTRSTAIGPASALNIQDANILKVEVTYGYELKVPLVNWFISRVLLSVHRGGGTMHAFERQLLRRMLLPVIATATVRMQSPARMSDLVVSRKDLPELARIPSDARPPPEKSDPREGDSESGGDDQQASNGGSNLSEGFLGFGSGSGSGSGEGGGTAQDDGSGAGGGGNRGNPQTCAVSENDSSGASVPNVLLPALAVGNPIHVVTGNKYQREADLRSLPGTLAIEFTRHYNSEATDHAGVLGAGWRHSYEASIRVGAAADWIDLWQADGRHLEFRRTEVAGKYLAKRAGDGELTAQAAGHTWRWPTGRELLFAADGRLSSIREGSGSLVLHYNDARQLISAVDPQQRTLRFEYYRNGRLAAVHAMAKATWRYTYDAVGNLAQSAHADGSLLRYEYADARHPHHLTGISAGSLRPTDYGEPESLERIATWAYDAQGRGILSSHPNDAGKVTLQYGRGYTDVTDAFGRVSRYVTSMRDGTAMVSEVRGPGCSRCGQGDATYQYDESFQLTEVAARHSPTLRYEYDNRRLIAITRESALIARYRYKGDATRPERIELPSIKPDGMHFIAIEYAPNGQPRGIRESGYSPTPEGGFSAIEREVAIDYDAVGRVKAIDGPRTDVKDVAEFAYDAKGRLARVRAADGQERRVDYDVAGRPVRLSQSAGHAIGIEYNLAGRITALTQFRGSVERRIQYRYDRVGRLTAVMDPDGREQVVAYDAAGRASRFSENGSDTVEERLYAPDGQLSGAAVFRRSGELLRALHYSYDAQRRLQEVRDGDGPPLRRYEYLDGDTEPHRVIDPLGFEIALGYDRLGNLDSMLSPDGGSTRFSRDESGRLVGVTAPNDARTSYAYDDFGRRVREDSPDRGTTDYRYDAAGNLIGRTDARRETTTYVYDAANRLIEVAEGQGKTRLEYNNGVLSAVSGPSSEERFQYGVDGQLKSHHRRIAGKTFSTSYGYDLDGRLKTLTLPSGARLRYRYTREGALRSVIQEGWFGNRVLLGDPDDGSGAGAGRLTFGNRLVSSTAYNPRTGHITRRATEGVSKEEYEYDEAGRVVGIKGNSLAGSFHYDPVGRLTAATTPLGKFTYSYDPNGNRLASSEPSRPVPASFLATRGRAWEGATATRYAYEPQSNRLSEVEGSYKTLYRYDAAGNPIQIGNLRYEYDSAGRLVRLFKDDRLVADYAYNAWGERIRKTLHGRSKPETTLYTYEKHRLIAESNALGEVQREYLYLGQHPVAMLDHGTAYWIHTDRHGTPLAATDQDQRIVWKATYQPFGKALVHEDPDGDGKPLSLNLRFPGQYADSESGTHYNYFRNYDPQSGRYSTADPIGLEGGANSFSYVGQSPLNAIDPLGLYLFAFDGTWINRNSGVLTNVELFRRYYDPSFDEVNSYYRRGLGTVDPNRTDFENSVDRVLAGAFGFGGQNIIDEALIQLDRLISGDVSAKAFDGIIDIVGFSRGAAIARAFANRIYERIDGGYYDRALRSAGTCRSLRIRFMGLFDTVGAFGIPGNSIDVGYDFRIDDRVGTVAHAIALDEHRAAFDLVSIQNAEHSANTTPYREERGFIGSHSDIGGGYSTGDLSDFSLQWMYAKATAAGVNMTPLADKYRQISAPVVHDERTFVQDREIFYPNDPTWKPATCSGAVECLLWQPPVTQRQSTAPQFQFPELLEMIKENPQPEGVRGTVDIERYRSWLRSRGQL
jgi:RHS repeat-associated protein